MIGPRFGQRLARAGLGEIGEIEAGGFADTRAPAFEPGRWRRMRPPPQPIF